MEVYIAHNKCWKCNQEWHAEPGPHSECPACGHLYGTWLNYKEDRPLWCSICKEEFKIT